MTPGSAPIERRGQAFTLLEILLALAMVATLGLALYASMTIGFRARRTAHAQVAQMREASIVLAVAQEDLQSALRPAGVLAGAFVGRTQEVVDGTLGDAGLLDFYTLGRDAKPADPNEPESPFADGVRHVQILLRNDDPRGLLVRRVTRNLLAQTATEPDEEILARNVRAFTLRYFDGEAWQDEWDSSALSNTLPVAVEMTIELAPPGPSREGVEPKPYRVTQVIPLSVGVPLIEVATTGT
jgi:general secretion pathway protein J